MLRKVKLWWNDFGLIVIAKLYFSYLVDIFVIFEVLFELVDSFRLDFSKESRFLSVLNFFCLEDGVPFYLEFLADEIAFHEVKESGSFAFILFENFFKNEGKILVFF